MKWNVLSLAVMAALLPTCAPAAEEIVLDFPVACELGRTCEIQNYVDRNSAPEAEVDYRGGRQTYDAHNGTDIRVPTLAAQRQGVAVVAAAGGEVMRTRDGVDDISVKEPGRAAAVAEQECGNGVVIAHSGGWETQYCHLAKGSVRVRSGQTVSAGDALGLIGMSGETEYPHLHFTVRRHSEVVDPFAAVSGQSLWRTQPPYEAGAILNTGFASGPVTMASIDAGDPTNPDPSWPALVAYGRAIGLLAGDEQELVLRAPDGTELARNIAPPLPRQQAQSMLFAGKRRPPQGWRSGAYIAEYVVRRKGVVVLKEQFQTPMR